MFSPWLRAIAIACSFALLAGCANDASPAPAPQGLDEQRACAGAAWGSLATDWRRTSEHVGPVSFVGMAGKRGPALLKAEAPVLFSKVLVVVAKGKQARLSVPPELSGRISLLYDTAVDAASAKSVADGRTEITLQACAEEDAQFPGGFLVGTGSTGAVVDVSYGSASERVSFRLQ